MGNRATSFNKEEREEFVSKVAKIISAKWQRKIDADYKEVNAAKVKGSVRISLTTENIDNNTEIVISILDAKDNSELSTEKTRPKVKINDNKDEPKDITIEDEWNNKELLISITTANNPILEETYNGNKKLKICCCENIIVEGDSGEFIEELNIRLCGFSGIQPRKEVHSDTIKAVKQFQKDYMKKEETGIICKHVLESLDEFKDKYALPVISKLKCNCDSNGVEKLNHITGNNESGSCEGFGNASDRKKGIKLVKVEVAPEEEKIDGKTQKKETTYTIEPEYSKYVRAYNKSGNTKSAYEWLEKNNENKVTTKKYIEKIKYVSDANSTSCYEYPGMHRSLMWAYKALLFYLEKEYGDKTSGKYTVKHIESGYRCRYQQTFQDASDGLSFNHMGNAIDIHFYIDGERDTVNKLSEIKTCVDNIREDVIRKYMGVGAGKGWEAGKIGIERASDGATTWVHMDVREFINYKADKFYKQTLDDINGSKLIDLVKDMDDKKFKEVAN